MVLPFRGIVEGRQEDLVQVCLGLDAEESPASEGQGAVEGDLHVAGEAIEMVGVARRGSMVVRGFHAPNLAEV